MATPIWYPSEQVDAQFAHLGWGAFITLAGSFLWGWPIGIALLLAWAIPKEMAFDILIEKDTWSSSAFDFVMYLNGGVIGLAVFFFGLGGI